MATLTFELTGLVGVTVTVTELDDGSLQFTIKVDESSGTIGDLNALYFDLADDSLTAGLTVTGADITDSNFAANSVTKLDSFTNMNGEIVNEYGKFDAGIQLGSAGIAEDDIQETTFILSHDSVALTLDDILGQDFGVRLTSVGEEDGSRDGSLKLGGTAPDVPDTPEEPETVNYAKIDSINVYADEAFEFDGTTDALVSGAMSILDNDVSTDGIDTLAYSGDITAVNGDTAAITQVVTGDNGGQLIVYVDGTVDFSANGDFDDVVDFQSEVTNFDYTIEGGSTAQIQVTVNGGTDIDIFG